MIFQFCFFWLLSTFGNIAVQLKFYLSGTLTGPEKIVRNFFIIIFSTKFKILPTT